MPDKKEIYRSKRYLLSGALASVSAIALKHRAEPLYLSFVNPGDWMSLVIDLAILLSLIFILVIVRVFIAFFVESAGKDIMAATNANNLAGEIAAALARFDARLCVADSIVVFLKMTGIFGIALAIEMTVLGSGRPQILAEASILAGVSSISLILGLVFARGLGREETERTFSTRIAEVVYNLRPGGTNRAPRD